MSAAQERVESLTRQQALAQLTGPGESHELVEVEVLGRPCRWFKNAPQTLGELYESTRSEATFLVYDDERYSFEEVHRRAAKIATVLRDQYGVVKGDRVAIVMRNFPEWIMAFNAATSMGAIAVAMNAHWQTDEIEFGLKDCGAKVLFADQERLDRIQPFIAKLPVEVIAVRPKGPLPKGIELLDDLVATLADVPMPGLDSHPDDDCTILYTSGSTGKPKGAVSSHRNIISALFSWELDGLAAMRMLKLEPPPPPANQIATLLATPLFHVGASHAVLLQSYRSQRRVVMMYRWDPNRAAELIEKEKITSFTAPPAMTGDLVAAAKRTDRDLSSLLRVGGGGAARAPEQVKDIDSTFSNAAPGTGWGMTETNAIGTGIGGDDYLKRPNSSGRCSAVLDIRVVDEQGNELASGGRGELQIRGVSMIRGYWNRPQDNAETFVDGWMRTGDVAYIDEEGYLFIVDRIKDMVIRGGENIGCAEVEAALLEHPQVLEAAVYWVQIPVCTA